MFIGRLMDARVSFVTAPMKRSGINSLPFPDPDGRNTEYTPGSSVEVAPQKYSAVSYTHLTLPTIYSV